MARAIQPAGGLQHAIGGGRADGHDVVIEHHESQPTIAIEGMTIVEVQDGLLLPILEPPVPRDFSVMLVGLTVSFLPIMKLAGAQPEPRQQTLGGQLGPFRPMLDIIDDVVAGIVGNPASF